MLRSKLITHGHWIYDHDTGWKLTIYPIVTMTPPPGGDPFYQSVVLAKECSLQSLGTPCDAIEKVFSSTSAEAKSLALYNLGSFCDEDQAEELELYLICPIANIKDGITHPVITDEGYMYVEDLGIDVNSDDDDPLDKAIYAALCRLEAPHQITCS